MPPNREEVLKKIEGGDFLPLCLTLNPLQTILAEIIALIKDQDAQIADLKGQLADKADKESLNKLESLVIQNDKESKDRDAALEALINEKAKDLSDKLAATNTAVDANKQSCDRLDHTCNNLEQELNALKDRVAALESNTNNNNSEDFATKSVTDDLAAEIADLKKQVGDLAGLKQQLDGVDIAGMQNQLQSMKDQLQALKDQLARLQNRQERRVEMKSAPQQTGNVEGLSDLMADVADLKDDVDALKQQTSKISDLQDQIKKLSLDINRMNQEIMNLGGKDINPSDFTRDLEDRLQKLGSQLDLFKSDSKAKFDELNGQASETSKRVRGISRSVEDLSSKVAEIDGRKPSVLIQPPPERADGDDRNPRVVSRDISSDSSSHKKIPLPDLTSADQQEAIAQLRAELTKLTARVTDNESKTAAKNAEYDAQIKALQDAIRELQEAIAALQDTTSMIQKDLANRPDRAMIERLFEKFKASVNGLANSLGKKDQGGNGVATLEDIKRLESSIANMSRDWEEAAAARKSTCCLSCGKPYRTVTGAIQDEATLAVLGAAPIQHLAHGDGANKPCFVYGSDKELYYSQSPRGRTYVASQVIPKTAPGAARQ